MGTLGPRPEGCLCGPDRGDFISTPATCLGTRTRHEVERVEGEEEADETEPCQTPMEQFVDRLMARKSPRLIAIAHYSSKYDTHLVLEELYKRCDDPTASIKLKMIGFKIYR